MDLWKAYKIFFYLIKLILFLLANTLFIIQSIKENFILFYCFSNFIEKNNLKILIFLTIDIL